MPRETEDENSLREPCDGSGGRRHEPPDPRPSHLEEPEEVAADAPMPAESRRSRGSKFEKVLKKGQTDFRMGRTVRNWMAKRMKAKAANLRRREGLSRRSYFQDG